MGYFPNGTSFACWQEENCSDCLNYRDNGTGSFGCAITDAHFLLETHGKRGRRLPAFKFLDLFVPDTGPEAFVCKMRLTRQMLDDGLAAEKQQRDRERYDAAIAEMHAIAIEAAIAAETVKLGSVHESAGPQDIAQPRARKSIP